MSKKGLMLAVVLLIVLLAIEGFGCSKAPTPASSPAAKPVTTPASVPSPAQTIIIKYAHSGAETYCKHLYGLEFQKLAEAKTNGRVKVEIYPRAQLYADAEAPYAVLRNSIQMTNISATELASWEPGFNVFYLPLLWESQDQLVRFYRASQGGGELSKRLEAKGLRVASWLVLGPLYVYTKKPINSLKDLQGTKMRVPVGDLNVKVATALGMAGVSISVSEVYTALQQGMIDGMITAEDTVMSYKWNEVAKYGLDGFVVSTGALPTVIAPAFWDSLPQDIRKVLNDEVLPAAEQAEINYQLGLLKTTRDKAISGGMQFTKLPTEDIQTASTKLQPVYNQFAPVIGLPLVDFARSLTKK